jgi:hypothetical protein
VLGTQLPTQVGQRGSTADAGTNDLRSRRDARHEQRRGGTVADERDPYLPDPLRIVVIQYLSVGCGQV